MKSCDKLSSSTHQPHSPIIWCNSMVSSLPQIIWLINTIKNITSPYCFSTFSFSSFPNRSSLPCFSLPPVISVAPGPVLLPVLLTHRLPCLTHQQCTISTGCFAGRRLDLDWGMSQQCAGRCATEHHCDENPPAYLSEPRGHLWQAQNHFPLFTSPSCLIYTDPAQRESSSEAIFEFRGLVGN